MKIGVITNFIGLGAAVAVPMLYAYGLVLGAIYFLPKYLWTGEWPQWPWWGWLVAPLLLGAAAGIVELTVGAVVKRFPGRTGDALIVALLIVGLGVAIALGNA